MILLAALLLCARPAAARAPDQLDQDQLDRYYQGDANNYSKQEGSPKGGSTASGAPPSGEAAARTRAGSAPGEASEAAPGVAEAAATESVSLAAVRRGVERLWKPPEDPGGSSPEAPARTKRRPQAAARAPFEARRQAGSGATLARPDAAGGLTRQERLALSGALRAPDARLMPELKDVGQSEDGRSFLWTATCSEVEGGCNPLAPAAAYRRGQRLSPETLNNIWTRLERRRSEDPWKAFVDAAIPSADEAAPARVSFGEPESGPAAGSSRDSAQAASAPGSGVPAGSAAPKPADSLAEETSVTDGDAGGSKGRGGFALDLDGTPSTPLWKALLISAAAGLLASVACRRALS